VLDDDLADYFRLLKAQRNDGHQVDGSNWNPFFYDDIFILLILVSLQILYSYLFYLF